MKLSMVLSFLVLGGTLLFSTVSGDDDEHYLLTPKGTYRRGKSSFHSFKRWLFQRLANLKKKLFKKLYCIFTKNNFSGAVFAWVDIMDRIKTHANPSGYGFIQDIIDSLNKYNKDYITNNLRDLTSLYRNTGRSFKKLVPHIMDEKVSKALATVADECEDLAQNLEKGDGLDYAVNYVEKGAHQLLSAMGLDY